MGVRRFLLSAIAVLCLIFSSRAQSAGEVMFVGFNADGNDGFAFVTFVSLPPGTEIHFSDNEWNGNPIGGGGAFNTGEGALTWQNNTGNSISPGLIVVINNSSTTPTASLGTVSSGTIALAGNNEVLYMFLGSDSNTPTTFLSAIANDGFGNGTIANTGLTDGTNATSITGDEDVMVYTGSTQCTVSIAACAAAIANSSNWSTEDGGGNQSNNGGIDFPASVDVNFYGTVLQGLTYYSRNATLGGNWDDPNSWTTVSDGSGGPLAAGIWPASADNVVILSGHTVTINAVTDNQAAGVSPNGLGRSNIGTFTGSGDLMFYHTGDIIISGGGTLTSSEEIMLEGYAFIENSGTLTVSEDAIILGYFEVAPTASFNNTDDLILSGNSITIINNLSFGADDIYIDHTDATLCGDGVMNLGNGGADPTVQFFNGGSLSQICSTFMITCTSNCGAFPITTTGNFSVGNSGPGGVAASNGSSELVLWLDGNRGVMTSGSAVTSWEDQSGYNNDANPAAPANQPALNAAALNGFPTLTFDGTTDFLAVSDDASIDLTAWSFFMVTKVNLHKNYNAFFTKGNDLTENFEFLSNFPSTGDIHFPIFYTNATRSSDAETAGSMSNTIFGIFQYDYDNSDILMMKNLNQIFTRAETRTPQVNALDLLIGNEAGTSGRNLSGDMAEFFVYNSAVNQAKRIIINNYLSAKYDITIGASDVYTMDDGGNGNYDFEVAGIGQAANGSNHRDARGTDVVRMWNPNNLGNSEFLMWGHDNTALNSSTTAVGTAVDGTVIQERLSRIWRVSETGDVGNVSISFDFNGVGGSPLGSNLRLLIDRNGDGFADNDVTPIVGSVSNGIAVFSNVNFQNGDRFTLGNTDASSPLPVELVTFTASPLRNAVELNWTTASELNNDYFNVERSLEGEQWELIATEAGAGTTTKTTSYEAMDYQPINGVSYYRLRQTDFDGKVSFSHIERVDFTGQSKIQVFPNPSDGIFHLANSAQLDIESIRVVNNLGQIVYPLIRKDEDVTIDLSQLSQGIYLLQVWNGTFLNTVRLVKRN